MWTHHFDVYAGARCKYSSEKYTQNDDITENVKVPALIGIDGMHSKGFCYHKAPTTTWPTNINQITHYFIPEAAYCSYLIVWYCYK